MKRIILTGFMVVFSLFLFSQSPVKALHVGDKVPDAFWTTPEILW